MIITTSCQVIGAPFGYAGTSVKRRLISHMRNAPADERPSTPRRRKHRNIYLTPRQRYELRSARSRRIRDMPGRFPGTPLSDYCRKAPRPAQIPPPPPPVFVLPEPDMSKLPGAWVESPAPLLQRERRTSITSILGEMANEVYSGGMANEVHVCDGMAIEAHSDGITETHESVPAAADLPTRSTVNVSTSAAVARPTILRNRRRSKMWWPFGSRIRKNVNFHESPLTGRPVTRTKRYVVNEAVDFPSPNTTIDEGSILSNQSPETASYYQHLLNAQLSPHPILPLASTSTLNARSNGAASANSQRHGYPQGPKSESSKRPASGTSEQRKPKSSLESQRNSSKHPKTRSQPESGPTHASALVPEPQQQPAITNANALEHQTQQESTSAIANALVPEPQQQSAIVNANAPEHQTQQESTSVIANAPQHQARQDSPPTRAHIVQQGLLKTSGSLSSHTSQKPVPKLAMKQKPEPAKKPVEKDLFTVLRKLPRRPYKRRSGQKSPQENIDAIIKAAAEDDEFVEVSLDETFGDLNIDPRRINVRDELLAEKEALEKAVREAEEREQAEKLAADIQAQLLRDHEEYVKSHGVRQFTREPIIAPLTAEQEERLDRAMAKGAKVSALNNIELSSRDWKTVLPTDAWLNDNIINAYLDYVVQMAHDRVGLKRNEAPKMHAFNNNFYNNLSKNGYTGVARWARRAKIAGKTLLSLEYIFVPVNATNNHWTLAVISPARRTIEYFDSLHIAGRQSSVVSHLKQWLKGELGDAYVADEWNLRTEPGPHQGNYSDCGVHTVTTAKLIALGIDPMAAPSALMPLQRRRIVAELLNSGFHGEFEADFMFA